MTDVPKGITAGKYIKLLKQAYEQAGRKEEAVKGVLEAEDQGMFLDRKNAARITHEFLRTVCKEKDEMDWSAAKRLKDLYDCHTCVNHVAQIYVKGIMEATKDFFGMNLPFAVEEAKCTALRCVNKEYRTPHKSERNVLVAQKLFYHEALKRKEKDTRVRLIDVRSKMEFEEQHLVGAVSIPLSEILKNPYLVSESKDTPLLFYCDKAYQSELAANCAMDAGYPDVGYFGTDEYEK